MRQAGVIRVETIEQLMDVAQIVVRPAAAARARASPSSATPGRWAKWWRTAPAAHGLGVERHRHRTLTSTPACRWRCRPCAPACQETLRPSSVHAVVVALLPARGLTVESIAGVLAECSAEAGKPVVAAFTGILDPSIYVEGMVGAEAATSTVPCYSNPGAAVAALAAVVRYAAVAWTGTTASSWSPRAATRTAPGTTLEQLLARRPRRTARQLDAGAAAALLAALRHRCGALLRLRYRRTRPWRPRTGWAGRWRSRPRTPRCGTGWTSAACGWTSRTPSRCARTSLQMRRALEPYGSPSLEVQTMAPVGQACTFRAIEDPLLGPVVSFGLAGDAVNLLDDWAHRVPPLSGADLHDFIRAPRASRKLFGYQGLPAVDVAALEDLAARLARLKDNHPEIALVEFNPVLAGPAGATDPGGRRPDRQRRPAHGQRPARHAGLVTGRHRTVSKSPADL